MRSKPQRQRTWIWILYLRTNPNASLNPSRNASETMVIINNANNYIDSISGALSACDLLRRFIFFVSNPFLGSLWSPGSVGKKFSFGFCHLMSFFFWVLCRFRFGFVMANLPALHFGFLLINLTSTSARHRIYDLAKSHFRPVPSKCCVCVCGVMSYEQSRLPCSWLIIAVSRLGSLLHIWCVAGSDGTRLELLFIHARNYIKNNFKT